ncbi:hypothetical protein MUK42_27987 [Musa troglodytarum]|uniref:Uncharacterized protein n=1 Tax=Musa troglodytarum TaxID=320322 RepID=A0A9E7F7I5_9LILI|nr:hypothetical protein MUK42_27987 [Musa troglodytarum]
MSFLRARSSSARVTVESPYPEFESTPTLSSSGQRVLGLRIPHYSGGMQNFKSFSNPNPNALFWFNLD